VKMRGLSSAAWLLALTAGLCAQAPARTPPPATQTPEGVVAPQGRPTFRVVVDLVRTDVVPRDDKGNFVPDLSRDDFEVFEDGVKQDLTSMTMSYGGRVKNLLAPPAATLSSEGIILPPARPVNDISGRIFVFFIDDLHIQFHNTGRVRDLFKRVEKQLIHDGDMFGIVSSGTSSISVQMTYDKKRLDEAIQKMTGSELRPEDIINGSEGAEGPTEVRWRAHVAFSTVNELLQNLEKVHDRRKALIYVSDGYDFNPFQDSRLGLMDPNSPFLQNQALRQMNAQAKDSGGPLPSNSDPFIIQQKQNTEFADADLARELGEVTRQANRSNVTIYSIDPRGLVTGTSDIDQPVDPQQWQEYLRKSQDSMRVLAEETGGIAVVNMNDFDKGLKRIDVDTSDYYILGYYSSNPDITQRRRKIEVRVKRPNVTVQYRKEYVLETQPIINAQPPPPAAPASAIPVIPASPKGGQ
jgi:VWFA-related protein